MMLPLCMRVRPSRSPAACNNVIVGARTAVFYYTPWNNALLISNYMYIVPLRTAQLSRAPHPPTPTTRSFPCPSVVYSATVLLHFCRSGAFFPSYSIVFREKTQCVYMCVYVFREQWDVSYRAHAMTMMLMANEHNANYNIILYYNMRKRNENT